MTKLLAPLILLILAVFLNFKTFAAGAFAAGAPKCAKVLADTERPATEITEEAELKDLVKAKNPSKTIRSSAGHFWRVTKKIINGDIPSDLSRSQRKLLQNLMQAEGWVIGDLHNGNVGPLRVGVTAENPKGKIDYTVVDYDDPAPKGSLVFDFVHHVIAAKAVETPTELRISKQEMFDDYLTGLRGKKYAPPSRISKLLNISPEEFRQLEIKKAKKFTTANGLQLIKDGVKSSEITPAETQSVLRETEKAIGEHYEILDVGGREKDSGGSAGALRYLLLVKEKSTGDSFLFELKQEAVSAVAEYDKQPDYSYADRLDHYVNKNNPKDIRFQSLNLNIEGQNVKMTLRPKPLYFFDYANDGSRYNAFKEFRDLTLFNSFWLGFKQRRDDASNAVALLKKINEEGTDKTFEALKILTRDLNAFYEAQARQFRDSQDSKGAKGSK